MALFLYGSWCSNGAHFPLIQAAVRSAEPALASGFVFRLPVGYPAFVRDYPGAHPSRVAGELMEFESLQTLLPLLDEFHGISISRPEQSVFQRQELLVRLSGGETRSAMAYVLSPEKLPIGAQLVADGDWEKTLTERPALPEMLTDRQASYIRRLGKSTGREIVPIDLDLYRELTKLELVIDKGRRLALTKLGREVFRYLPEA